MVNVVVVSIGRVVIDIAVVVHMVNCGQRVGHWWVQVWIGIWTPTGTPMHALQKLEKWGCPEMEKRRYSQHS